MNKQSIQADGAVVYWSAGPTRRDLLIANLRALSIEHMVPEQRTDAACLRSAIKDYCDEHSQRRRGRDKIIQARKQQRKNGFEVLDVNRGEDGNDYQMDFAARVDNGFVIAPRCPFRDQLQKLFDAHKGQLTGAAVGSFLVDVLGQLKGIALRPHGGVYWIPGSSLEDWERIAAVVEKCATDGGKNTLYAITHLFNEASVRAVKDAIVDEVTAASESLVEDIKTNDLGPDALIRRQIMAASLHARVKQYEAILGQALTTLHDTVRVAEEAAAAAMSVATQDNQFAGIM
jgi:hypothetical protein